MLYINILYFFLFQLKSKVSNSKRDDAFTLKVIGQTETPFGMMNLREILNECVTSHKSLQFEAFVFGSDDFLASIG